jgi:hypothetical protein
MAAWTAAKREPNRAKPRFCLACGKQLEPTLQVLGSLRCLDCRESQALLDPALVAISQRAR